MMYVIVIMLDEFCNWNILCFFVGFFLSRKFEVSLGECFVVIKKLIVLEFLLYKELEVEEVFLVVLICVFIVVVLFFMVMIVWCYFIIRKLYFGKNFKNIYNDVFW